MDPLNISVNALGKIQVTSETNRSVLLSDSWKDKTAVLVFVRHFG